jgi:hypothetical protein
MKSIESFDHKPVHPGPRNKKKERKKHGTVEKE